jgi:alpha-L-rhamnosidase
MIEMGATTMWERWDGYVESRGTTHKTQFQAPGMNSFNHWAFGSVGEWVWRNIAGINPDEQNPGYKHFIIRPRPGPDFTWARGEYDSIYGTIESHWRLLDGIFKLKVAVPANTTATVYIPAANPDDVIEGNRPVLNTESVRLLKMAESMAVFAVDSGCYQFESKYPE